MVGMPVIVHRKVVYGVCRRVSVNCCFRSAKRQRNVLPDYRINCQVKIFRIGIIPDKIPRVGFNVASVLSQAATAVLATKNVLITC